MAVIIQLPTGNAIEQESHIWKHFIHFTVQYSIDPVSLEWTDTISGRTRQTTLCHME